MLKYFQRNLLLWQYDEMMTYLESCNPFKRRIKNDTQYKEKISMKSNTLNSQPYSYNPTDDYRDEFIIRPKDIGIDKKH